MPHPRDNLQTMKRIIWTLLAGFSAISALAGCGAAKQAAAGATSTAHAVSTSRAAPPAATTKAATTATAVPSAVTRTQTVAVRLAPVASETTTDTQTALSCVVTEIELGAGNDVDSGTDMCDDGSVEVFWLSDPNSVPCSQWAAGYDDPKFTYDAYLGWNVCAGIGEGSASLSVVGQALSMQTSASSVRVLHEP